MNKKYKRASLLGVLGLTAISVASVSAMGFGQMMGGNTLTPDEIATRQTAVFQEQASLIGASVDEVKTAWAAGKDFKTLASEKGITADQLKAKMDAERLSQMKAHMQTLVTKGVITQAQADSRITFMEKQATTKNGKKGMRGGRHGDGMMGGFGF